VISIAIILGTYVLDVLGYKVQRVDISLGKTRNHTKSGHYAKNVKNQVLQEIIKKKL